MSTNEGPGGLGWARSDLGRLPLLPLGSLAPPSHPALLPDRPSATPMCSPWALLRVCVELKLRASLWPHPNLPWAKALRQLRAYRIQSDFLGTSQPV